MRYFAEVANCDYEALFFFKLDGDTVQWAVKTSPDWNYYNEDLLVSKRELLSELSAGDITEIKESDLPWHKEYDCHDGN